MYEVNIGFNQFEISICVLKDKEDKVNILTCLSILEYRIEEYTIDGNIIS